MPIGVDVEQILAKKDLDAIAKRFFSVKEQKQYAQLPPEQKPAGFYNCWTRKEAFVKALGDGLAYPLVHFDVSLTPNSPARLERIGDDPAEVFQWSLHGFYPEPGYVGAVAIRVPDVKIDFYEYHPERNS